MAMTATLVTPVSGDNVRIFDMTALDADTTGTFSHHLPFTPEFAQVMPAVAGCYTGLWAAPRASITGTSFTVTKGTASGSGGGTPGTTVVCQVAVGRYPRPQNER
jgi:hypothetical protein